MVTVGQCLVISPPGKSLEHGYLQPPWLGLTSPTNAVATSESLLISLLMSFLSSVQSVGLTASSLSLVDVNIGPLYIYN